MSCLHTNAENWRYKTDILSIDKFLDFFLLMMIISITQKYFILKNYILFTYFKSLSDV